MAAIESNLLIKSKLEPPSGSGFKDILNLLTQIDTLVDKIDGRSISVSVKLTGSKAAIDQLNQLGGAAGSARTATSGVGISGVGGVGGGTTRTATSGGRSFIKRTTVKTESSEGEVNEAITNTFQAIKSGFLVTERLAEDGSRDVTEELDIGNAKRIAIAKKEIEDQVGRTKKQNEALQAADDRRFQEVQRQQAAIRRRNQVANSLGQTLPGQGFTQGVSKVSQVELSGGKGQTAEVRVDSFTKSLADGSQQIITYNTATGRMNDANSEATQKFRDLTQIQKLNDNQVRLSNETIRLQAQGFKQHKSTLKDFAIGQQQVTSEVREFRKVTGSALTGNLQVELKKFNTRTGEMSSNILRANDAMRLIGDSVSNAVAKVALWTGATTLIFGSVAAIGKAIDAIKELEANTIFLARVGSSFGATFNERLEEAKILTQDLIRESQILGTSAADAQQAAAIFARAGQNREQVLKSTRAALIASRIAELEVIDAARLLSAALLQFNLRAEDLLPTLDSLNTLSNKYRVSTDDLLQSISRAGTVYADTNGELEELAALTAIVARNTGRSGAEIGNAFKTIISRLAAPETRGNLLREIGLAAQDSEGKTKDFIKVLLQLQVATEGLSEAERDAVLVQVAGARQLNVLRSAVNDAVDAVIAYAQAQRGSGGALEEAQETSVTLDASLKRLQATFIALADSSGKSIGPLLVDLADAAAVVVNLITVFDNVVIKVGLFLLAFFAVRLAITKLSASFGILTASIASTTASMFTLGVSATATTVAAQGLSAALTALNIKAVLFTLGLSLLIEGMASYRQAEVDAELATQNFIEKIDKAVNASQRRAKATFAIVDALNEQISALERLEDFPEKERAKNTIEGNIQRLARDPSVNIDITRNREGEIDTIKLQRDALNALNTERDEEAKKQREQIFTAKQALLSLEANLKYAEDLRDFARKQLERPRPLFAQEFALGDLNNALEEINKLIEEIDQLKTKISEFEVTAQQALSETFTSDSLLARKALQGLADEFGRFSERAKVASRFPELFGSKLQRLGFEIDDLTDVQQRSLKEFEKLNRFDQNFDDFIRNVEGVTEALEAAKVAAADLRIESLQKVFGATIGGSSEIFRALQEQEGRLDFIRNKDIEGGPLFEQANAIRNAANAAKQDANRLGAILDDEKLFNPDNREESQAIANEIQKQIDENLNKAREAEVDFVKEILDIEVQITEERHKQNIETQRALGLLSEEDKILLLRQGQFFAENPNAKINAEQQFLADAETNKINQQFFGKFLQEGLDPGQPFDRGLLDLGVGPGNRDLDAAQAKLDAEFDAVGGRDKFIEGRLRDSEELARVQNKLRGEPVPEGDNLIIDRALFDAGALDVVVNLDPIDFDPLVDAFRDVILIEIQENRDAMIADLRDIWGEVNQLKIERNGVPQVRVPQVDIGE